MFASERVLDDVIEPHSLLEVSNDDAGLFPCPVRVGRATAREIAAAAAEIWRTCMDGFMRSRHHGAGKVMRTSYRGAARVSKRRGVEPNRKERWPTWSFGGFGLFGRAASSSSKSFDFDFDFDFDAMVHRLQRGPGAAGKE